MIKTVKGVMVSTFFYQALRSSSALCSSCLYLRRPASRLYAKRASPPPPSSSSTQMQVPPVEPASFGKDFTIHINDEKPIYLQEVNAHKNDDKLTFDEKGHKYTFDGKVMENSVTQIVENFFEKFETDKVIERMMNGPKWPRPDYTWTDTGIPYTATEIKDKWASVGEYARYLHSNNPYCLHNSQYNSRYHHRHHPKSQSSSSSIHL